MAQKPKTKSRPRNSGLPAGWTWRDGRPRWIPSPTLRDAGWRGVDLKAKDGAWLTEGQSIDRAREITAGVKLWRDGFLVPADLAAIAPEGAAEAARSAPAPTPDKHSIGRLLDAYTGSQDGTVKPSEVFADLARSTQRDYRGKLKRLVDVLAGWMDPPDLEAQEAVHAAYAADVAQVRGYSVHVLAPVEEPEEGEDPSLLHTVYRRFKRERGDHMAAGVLTVTSAWLEWCQEFRSKNIINYAKLVSRSTPAGRLRVATWDELQALVTTADRMGEPEIGDAIVLAVDLSWSQKDLLGLQWNHITAGRARKARTKTGAMMETPLLALGLARIEKIRERQDNVRPARVVYIPRERQKTRGEDADSHYFRHRFAAIRAEAAKTCPSLTEVRIDEATGAEIDLTLRFQDLRDTAVTLAYDAGLDEQEIASRTGHSLTRIRDILDSHYGKISRIVADRGARKLNDHFRKQGFKL